MKAIGKKIVTGSIITSLAFGIGFGFVGSTPNLAYADSINNYKQFVNSGNRAPGQGLGGLQAGDLFKAAATVLGLEETAVMASLKEGKTLADIAADQGLSEDEFLQELVAAVTASIDAQVTAGTLTQTQADKQLSGLSDRLKQQIESKITQLGPVGGNTQAPNNAGYQTNSSVNKPSGKFNSGVQSQGSNAAGNEVNLVDINNHWAAKYIKELVSKGIVQGDDNKRFNPDHTVTREELATMVAKSFNLNYNNSSSKSSFADVDSSRWSHNDVEATKDFFDTQTSSNGIQQFNPTQGAKRVDVAVTLAKVLMKQNNSMTLPDASTADQLLNAKFKDSSSIPTALRPYVAAAVQHNLIQGDDEGNFAANKTITRAEVAALLDRILTNNS